MTALRRRQFLRAASAYASLCATGAQASTARPLVTDPKRVLDLPPGFTYRIVSRAGDRMHDGYHVPGNPDAMGLFDTGDALILMRNHEVAPGDSAKGPYGPGVSPPPQAYDPAAYGGVTRLVLDRDSLAPKRQELALCGTHWNCAGGLSPWGWLTCEEIFVPEHGYVFLAPHDTRGLTQARPIKGYGRFRHEAASVDPRTSIAYLTEDREDAAFYRFVPTQASSPFQGKLQALRVKGQPRFDSAHMPLHKQVAIDWVDVPNPDASEDDVRLQAHELGAASFARTEGLWLAGDELYMCATTGGPIGHGQIFRVHHGGEAQTLEVLAHSADAAVLDMPDNIVISPHGDLWVAEDGLEGNYLRRVSLDGKIHDFARVAGSASELTGPCFTPDGRALFVNLQRDGLTLVIEGPFELESQSSAAAQSGGRSAAALSGFGGLGAGLAVISLAALTHRRRTRRG
ncbi:MAG: alkaline phosphatase PhoX [Polyangiales bacterium]